MSKKKMTPFQEALVDSLLSDYGETTANQPEHIPSPEFEKWAQKKMKKKARRDLFFRIGKWLLILALASVLIVLAAMALGGILDPAAPSQSTVTTGKENDGITFDPSEAATAPQKIEKCFRLKYVPAQYVKVREETTNSSYDVLWTHPDGEFIHYTQWPIPEYAVTNPWIWANPEDERLSVYISGYQVEVINGQNSKKLVWTNNSYIFVLEHSAELSMEQIMRIFVGWTADNS